MWENGRNSLIFIALGAGCEEHFITRDFRFCFGGLYFDNNHDTSSI